ncbi:subtilisin family serine protease [Peribacillus simplex]|nr:S8 family serine peptidase [Peribacillus simplex]MDF9763786.1 subtilisin family serine protease [Peribacillus simplex]
MNNEYNSWGYDALNIEKVRKKYGVFGENVSIAILDTGVSSLEMIEIAGGVNILDTTKNPEDENGHGTFLAGIIKSIAPKADLYVVKTLKKDLTGTYEDIATGIEWARKKKVDIILMSFGGEKDTPVLKEAVQKSKFRRDYSNIIYWKYSIIK